MKKGILHRVAKAQSFAKNWENFPIFVTPEKFALSAQRNSAFLASLQ